MQCIWQILLVKLTKNIFRGVNFINLKTPDSYMAKSKSQEVCLQLNQTHYAIWLFLKKFFWESSLWEIHMVYLSLLGKVKFSSWASQNMRGPFWYTLQKMLTKFFILFLGKYIIFVLKLCVDFIFRFWILKSLFLYMNSSLNFF